MTVGNRPSLDYVNFKRRTIWSDLAPFSPTSYAGWSEAYSVCKHMCQMILFPNVFIIILCNSWFLAVNIAQGTTYATVLEGPPHNWNPKWAGMAQIGQIIVAFLCVPLLGFGSDRLITWKARRNNGIHQPENRLIPLAFPIAIGTFACVLFGYAYDRPFQFHWFAIVFSYAANYFAFIAASVA